MPSKDLVIDISEVDLNHVVADIDEIRRYNPQRYEAEQLTAIVLEDAERIICVGYKDVTDHEFWVRGHMPGMPIMPGVVMCEAAAQMCSYFTVKYNLLGAPGIIVGLGGLEDIRFRDPVRPGDRLVIACQQLKVRKGAMIVCRFQGFVREAIVVEGKMKGVPLPSNDLAAQSGVTR